MTDWATITAYIILLSIVAAIGVLVIMRKRNSKQCQIQDLRNPRKPDDKFYFVLNKGSGLIQLYTNLITPFKSGILPPLDLRPFTYWDGKLYGVRGATGNADDDSIALLRRPIVSMVECQQQSELLSDAVQNTVNFYNKVQQIGYCNPATKKQETLKLGDECEFELKKKAGTETLSGIVSAVGYDGITIDVLEQVSRKVEKVGADGKKTTEDVIKEETHSYLLPTIEDINNSKFKVTKTQKENREIGYDSFFTAKWVVTNFGVTPVDDVNPILISQKEFIAQYNSTVNDRVNAKKSWLERNIVVVTLLVAIVGLSVAFAIESYATSDYLSKVIGQGSAQMTNWFTSIANATYTLPAK